MIAMILLSLGLAQECPVDLATISSDTSVIWVSPLGARAGGGEYLWVTPTSEVAGWIRRQDRATIGSLLRHLGLRKSKKEPKKRYKVVVFDAEHSSLCRPMEGEAPGTIVAGLPVCEPAQSRATRVHNGCGRANEESGDGATLVTATWGDLSAAGFCVLPATRFLDEAR